MKNLDQKPEALLLGSTKRIEEYLQSMNKSLYEFSSVENGLLYLAEHLEESNRYSDLAKDLSKIRSKPSILKESICRKILQCFVHFRLHNYHPFTSILDGLFEDLSDFTNEYRSFLEEIVAEDCPRRSINYLESIMLFNEENQSVLFSIQDKVKILAYKYLLKKDPQHNGAIKYFLEFDKNRKISKYNHYFGVEENDWSGKGIVNEHGEWVLPPLFDISYGSNYLREGAVAFCVVPGYGNWVKPDGKYILDYLVPKPGVFSGGISRYYDYRNPKYVNIHSESLKDLEGKKFSYLANGYSVEATDYSVWLRGKDNILLARLEKDFWDVRYFPKDNLITYGRMTGREGRYGFLDANGVKITDAIFFTSWDTNSVHYSFGGKELLVLCKDTCSYGLVNRRFEVLIPFEYEKLSIVNSKYVIGQKGNDWYLFTTQGEIIAWEVPEAFQSTSIKYEGETGMISTKSGKSIVDVDGNPVAFFEKYEIHDFHKGYIILKGTNAKYGVYNVLCQEILPCDYDEIRIVSKELLIVRVDEQYMIINLSTKEKFEFPRDCQPFKFDIYFTEPFIRVVKDGKAGILNSRGEWLFPFLFFRGGYWGN